MAKKEREAEFVTFFEIWSLEFAWDLGFGLGFSLNASNSSRR
jgi:hypothetical protein